MSTSIVVIVVASVVGLIVLVAVFGLIWSRRRRKSAPLPPIQPLAHQRERKISQFHERQASLAGSISRPGTWYRPTPPFAHQSRTGTGSEDTLSEALLRPGSTLSGPSETQFSSAENMELKAPLMTALEMPRPHSTGEIATLPGSLFSPSSSSLPSGSNSTSPARTPPASRSQSKSRSRSRKRPASMVSSTSSSRMLPHGPHSSVQIVMPAPLALYPEQAIGERGRYISPSRVSLADPWASVTVSSNSGQPASVLEKNKRKSSRSRSRHRSQPKDAGRFTAIISSIEYLLNFFFLQLLNHVLP
jgi:hypothetical protein